MGTAVLLTSAASGSGSSRSPSRPTIWSRSESKPVPRRSSLVFLLSLATAPPINLTLGVPPSLPVEEAPPSVSTQTKKRAAASSSYLGGIANTSSWLQHYGDGFSIRVPPLFHDVTDPEDADADADVALPLYGDRAKTRTLAARFASPDRSEAISVVIRPTNQLKITFLEARDIADLGSLKSAAKIFVPGGSTLYNARTIRIREAGEEDDGDDVRSYYFYEFGIGEQRVALMAGVSSGKAFIAGAAAPRSRWEDDGVNLRSSAISLSVF